MVHDRQGASLLLKALTLNVPDLRGLIDMKSTYIRTGGDR